ncbi:MAG: DKNYY domain-containing protein, partial [Deltaproteobacteria bacterium]|nr:DKNYY domain-containing protein [Deltaproteobacteria bacterium]
KSHVYFFDSFTDFRFIQLKGADPETFVPLPAYFSKDKKQVYYHQYLIKKADPETFTPIIFEGARVDHDFEHIGYAYSKDKNHVFFKTSKIKDADRESFKVLSATRAKDKWRSYTKGQGAKKSSKSTCPLIKKPHLKK